MKTRTITRTRWVPETHEGRTHMVQDTYNVEIPIPPRDWDQIVTTGITAAALTVGAGSIAWSTSSIGALLATEAPTAVAYGGAATFDTLWIACLGLEWLARYEPAKAKEAHRAGLLCLLIAMAALVTEGAVGGHIAAGIIGACISAGTKRLWTLVLRRHARPLTDRMQQWVSKEQDTVSGQLALAAARRQLTRSRAQLAAYQAAYATDTEPTPDPDKPTGHPVQPSGTVRSAVRAALEVTPDASADDIVEQLARVGIDTDADTVRALSGQQADTPDSSPGTVLALAPHAPDDTITDTVRAAVRTVGHDLDAVLSAVRRVHGPDVKRETVRRLLARAAG